MVRAKLKVAVRVRVRGILNGPIRGSNSVTGVRVRVRVRVRFRVRVRS